MLMNLEIWLAILFTANVAILATIVSLAVPMSCNVQYLNKRLYYLKTVDISQKFKAKQRSVTSFITVYPFFAASST